LASDLSAAWEFLAGVTRARQRLATARHLIWERANLPTAEHTVVGGSPAHADERPPESDATDPIAVIVSVETLLKDGRRLVTCVELTAGPRLWRIRPYVALADATDRPIWEGQAMDRDDSAGFADMADAAASAVVEATLSVDFSAIERG
jgi:hypothetical protein